MCKLVCTTSWSHSMMVGFRPNLNLSSAEPTFSFFSASYSFVRPPRKSRKANTAARYVL